MVKCDIGLIGLGVMGQNLVLNMANHNYKVAVFNKTVTKVDNFIDGAAKNNKNVFGFHTLGDFIDNLSAPRKVFLMVKAGEAVDSTIDKLIPLLQEGDIIIDGGNSFYKDTIRRTEELKNRGILYLGVGVSGGEEGALHGPSIMPGGELEAYKQVENILVDISAKVDNVACCSYVGPDGAGHYVKMVHNGIEYADMQLISEAYYIMKELLHMNNEELQDTFKSWNSGDLDSYLMEITYHIMGKNDEKTGRPMVDVILDKAGQKGTGKWTSQEALDLGVSAPSIAESVFARYISAIKEERVKASKEFIMVKDEFKGDKKAFIEDIRRALYASKICSYAQGYAMLKKASEEYKWNLNFGDIALLWRGGCIIRARFLNRIKEAFDRNPSLDNLLLDEFFRNSIIQSQASWRRVVSTAILNGIAVPGFSSAISYYDSYRSESLPANLIQAQRDYFGAHTYERVDETGIFHTEWF